MISERFVAAQGRRELVLRHSGVSANADSQSLYVSSGHPHAPSSTAFQAARGGFFTIAELRWMGCVATVLNVNDVVPARTAWDG